jgi:hypothetical protein
MMSQTAESAGCAGTSGVMPFKGRLYGHRQGQGTAVTNLQNSPGLVAVVARKMTSFSAPWKESTVATCTPAAAAPPSAKLPAEEAGRVTMVPRQWLQQPPMSVCCLFTAACRNGCHRQNAAHAVGLAIGPAHHQ